MNLQTCIFYLLFLFGSVQLLGQGQADIWYFGEGVGLDFSSGDPEPLVGGNVFGNPQAQGEYLYSEGVAVISDSEANLLFYSNGEKAWNANHEVMPNGDDLMGMYSSTTAAFIVPQPGSDSLFYLFTTDGLERHLENGLRYSLVDMCLDDGKGDVVLEEKNILLLDTATEKLTATYHANGTDIWLVAHKMFSDAFYSYLITENGIVDTVISNIGSVHAGIPSYYGGSGGAIGQMKISPDGNKLALVFSNVNPVHAELFDFDPATGQVSGFIGLEPTFNGQQMVLLYSVEFSPNSSKLYLLGSGLYQYDLEVDNDSISINNSITSIPTGLICSSSSLQLAPDDKIYIGRCGNSIAVINEPNNVGEACGFEDNAVSFGAQDAKGAFPSFIAGLEYQNKIPECSVHTAIETNESLEIVVFPNPAVNQFKVRLDSKATGTFSLVLTDLSGRIVYVAEHNAGSPFTIEVSHLETGSYILTVSGKSIANRSELLLIQR